MFCNLLGEQLGQGCIVSSLEPLSPPALKKHPPPPPCLDDSWKIRWKKAVVVSPRVGQPALSGRTFNPDTCIEPPPDKIWSGLQKASKYNYDLVFKKPSKDFPTADLDVLLWEIFIMALTTKYNQSNHNLECSYQIKIVGWHETFEEPKPNILIEWVKQDFAQKKTDFPDWVATDPESGGGTQNLVPGTQIVVYILAVTAVTQLVLLFAWTARIARICSYCLHRVLGAGNISAPRMSLLWLDSRVEPICKWRNGQELGQRKFPPSIENQLSNFLTS